MLRPILDEEWGVQAVLVRPLFVKEGSTWADGAAVDITGPTAQ